MKRFSLRAAAVAIAALAAAPAHADTTIETTLDDYTEQPGTFTCAMDLWMFQPLIESCYHRTIESSYLENAVLTVGSGKLELQGTIDVGEVRISTTCGPQNASMLQGCGPTFPAHWLLLPLDISNYERFTVDFELHSNDPITIGLEGYDGFNYETSWSDFNSPGTHTFTAPPFSSINDKSVVSLTLVIKSDFIADLDIELEPLMFEEDYPAPYVTATTLDDYTEQAGVFGCSPVLFYWLFQSLSESCYDRTITTYALDDPTITVGSGKLEVQGTYFSNASPTIGNIQIWTSCGPQTPGATEGCGTSWPGYNPIPTIQVGSIIQYTMDLELRSTSPIRVGIRLEDGVNFDTHWTHFDTPGTYSITAPASSFTTVDKNAVTVVGALIEPDPIAPFQDGPLDIELGPVMLEDLDDQLTFCPAGTSASGCTPSVWVTGMHSGNVTFETTSGVESNKDGLFFYGVNGRQMNSWGNGNSFQCVIPPVTRLPLINTGGLSFLPCTGSASMSVSATQWCAGCPKEASRPPCGTPVQFQFWYRDPLNTSNQTTSLTSAVEFVMP